MYKAIDGLQLREALEALELQGFLATDQIRPNGQVRCNTCMREFPAGAFAMLMRWRVEGVSDPDDQNLVAGLRCPGCGALGTLVLPYGPRAGRDEAQVMIHLGHGQANRSRLAGAIDPNL